MKRYIKSSTSFAPSITGDAKLVPFASSEAIDRAFADPNNREEYSEAGYLWEIGRWADWNQIPTSEIRELILNYTVQYSEDLDSRNSFSYVNNMLRDLVRQILTDLEDHDDKCIVYVVVTVTLYNHSNEALVLSKESNLLNSWGDSRYRPIEAIHSLSGSADSSSEKFYLFFNDALRNNRDFKQEVAHFTEWFSGNSDIDLPAPEPYSLDDLDDVIQDAVNNYSDDYDTSIRTRRSFDAMCKYICNHIVKYANMYNDMELSAIAKKYAKSAELLSRVTKIANEYYDGYFES